MARQRLSRRKQKGAVAIIVGLLSVLVLFGLMGIAVDLSFLYTRKTEFQNAADAAALAGAKDIDHKQSGIPLAVDAAIAMFLQNAGSNLIDAEQITAANIRFGACPYASEANPNVANPMWVEPPDSVTPCPFFAPGDLGSDALAAGKTFIEVDTGRRDQSVLFMKIPSGVLGSPILNIGTGGYAVAGFYVNDLTPIGVCAVDPDNATSSYSYPDGTTELLELGFRRGVTYNIITLNPLGAPALPYLLNPVDAPPAPCLPNHSSADFTRPFICVGNSAILGSHVPTPADPGWAYVNTGQSAGVMERALNSRFGNYQGNTCEPATAPPDANIKEYPCTGGAAGCVNNPPAGASRDWMQGDGNTLPSRMDVVDSTTHLPSYSLPPTPNAAFANYGVLWSYSRAHDASKNPFGAPTDAMWQKLYNTAPTGDLLGDYPTTPGTGWQYAAPYNQPSGSDYFEGPSQPGKKDRRVLKIAILDCSTLGSAAVSCAPIKVVGIGRFFMPVKAALPGNINGEFAGVVGQPLAAEIRLYR